jgi:hypothetical protein
LERSTLRLEITDAAGLLADSRFERFLGDGRFGTRLGKIESKAHDLAFGSFCNRVVGQLADGTVRRNRLVTAGSDMVEIRLRRVLPERNLPLSGSSDVRPITRCLLPAACCLLPAACCLLPAACCLLPAAYCKEAAQSTPRLLRRTRAMPSLRDALTNHAGAASGLAS